MRIRNVQGAQEQIDNHPHVINEPEAYKGRWQQLFDKEQPLYIEIGMGKGHFLVQQAIKHPEINFVGFEKFTSVLVRAVEKLDENHEIKNIRLVRLDVDKLLDIFEVNEVSGIYLNFSDPWPKDRHIRRRLTHRGFLEKYKAVLKPGASLVFKTDNQVLFDFSIEEMTAFGVEFIAMTKDLHMSPYMHGNIMTEYEKKFSGIGHPICMVTVQFPK